MNLSFLIFICFTNLVTVDDYVGIWQIMLPNKPTNLPDLFVKCTKLTVTSLGCEVIQNPDSYHTYTIDGATISSVSPISGLTGSHNGLDTITWENFMREEQPPWQRKGQNSIIHITQVVLYHIFIYRLIRLIELLIKSMSQFFSTL